jgi:hypothetical protein
VADTQVTHSATHDGARVLPRKSVVGETGSARSVSSVLLSFSPAKLSDARTITLVMGNSRNMGSVTTVNMYQ